MAEERKSATPAPHYSDPFSAMRDEMDRLFDRFTGSSGLGFPRFSALSQERAMVPNVDVRESDKEIVVEAELPGIEEKDVSVSLQDGVLSIRGEKKFERKEDKDNYHMMERRYGNFQRSMRVPDTVDENKCAAKFDKGVLTVTLPKRPEVVRKERKIQITSG